LLSLPSYLSLTSLRTNRLHNPLDKGGDTFQVVLKKLADDDDGKDDAESCPDARSPTALQTPATWTLPRSLGGHADDVTFGPASEARLKHKRDKSTKIGEEEDFDTTLKEETYASPSSSSSSSSSSQPRTFRRAQRRTGNAPGPSPSAPCPANEEVEDGNEDEPECEVACQQDEDNDSHDVRRRKTPQNLAGTAANTAGGPAKGSPAPTAAAIALQAGAPSLSDLITIHDLCASDTRGVTQR
jgi:hypothetical protein